MDLQYPGWAIFGLTGNEFYFGCFSVLLGGRGGGVHVLSLSISLSFCYVYIYMCVPLILLHSVYRFFVPMSCFLRFTLCSFDFASIFHALVDCAAVPFSWMYDALMLLLYSANVGMNISRNEIEKPNRGNGAKCTMFVNSPKKLQKHNVKFVNMLKDMTYEELWGNAKNKRNIGKIQRNIRSLCSCVA